jgi:hypothetical protein
MLKKTTRYALLSGVAVLGFVVVVRMLFGPFDRPLQVRTPLNPEGWLGLALTVLLLTGSGGKGSKERQWGWWDAIAVTALSGATVAAFWRTIHFYFLSDDFIIVKYSNTFHLAFRPLFAPAWGDGFYRPIGNVSLVVTSLWAGFNPLAWHATALAIHCANVGLVFLLATRLSMRRLASSFAAALFAFHGTRPEAATWIAGRFDLVATFFVLAGLLLFLHSCAEAHRTGYLSQTLSLVCMVLAILSKESAYVFPLLLLLLLAAQRDLSRNRINAVIPFFVTAGALFAYRLWLFGGLGGYRNPRTGESEALIFGLSTLKVLAVRVWTALYFPINWSAEPETYLAVLTVSYIAALMLLAKSRPDRRLLTFGLGFVLVSVLPPLHLLGIGPTLENSRVLYLPSVGLCLMLAAAVDGLEGSIRWLVFAGILGFHLVALQHNLDAWDYASGRAKSASVVAAKCIGLRTEGSIMPTTLRGVPLFANGFREAVEMQQDRDTGPSTAPPRMLIWDRQTDEARCVAGR